MNKKIQNKQLYKLGEFISEFDKSYIIIGGTATMLLLKTIGDDSRVTKDVDMVIMNNENDNDFLIKLISFLKEGEYQNYYRDNKKYFYRFENPKNDNYPKMIEIFAGDELKLDQNKRYTRINIDDSYYYLSGIILDEDFFIFIKSGVILKERLAVLDYLYLIPLKMYAYNNLKRTNERKYDIQKHKEDVFKLCDLFKENDELILSGKIKNEVINFIIDISENGDVNSNKVFLLKKVYQIE